MPDTRCADALLHRPIEGAMVVVDTLGNRSKRARRSRAPDR
jgi:hypothetical protein